MFKILPDEDEIFVNILNNFKKTNLYFLSSGLNLLINFSKIELQKSYLKKTI